MIEVEISNFQAIDYVKFHIRGFTAIVGRSNIGKSSLIRALKCAFTGTEGSDFVRHDPKTCSRLLRGSKKCKCQITVKLMFEDGRILLWEKGDYVNQYTLTVDGKETVYSRVGRDTDVPAILDDGFTPIEVGKDKVLIQVADQFSPIFLLNSSGTVVADVLSDVAQLDDINKAMRAASKDRKAAASTRKIRETDIQTIEESLARYDGLDEVLGRGKALEDSYDDVQGYSGRVDQVAGFLDNFMHVGGAVKALRAAVSPPIPDLDPLTDEAHKVAQASGLLDELDADTKALRQLEGVDDVEIPDVSILQTKADRLGEASEFHQEYADEKAIVDQLEGVDTLQVPDLEAIRKGARDLEQLEHWLDHLVLAKGTYMKLKGVNDLQTNFDFTEARKVAEKVRKADELQRRLSSLQSVIKGTEAEYEEIVQKEADILEQFKSLGVCPTCTQPIHGACER